MTCARVVISPSSITKPVLVAVSQATRDIGILFKTGIQHGIRDLIAKFIRMALGHRFGCEHQLWGGHEGIAHWIVNSFLKMKLPFGTRKGNLHKGTAALSSSRTSFCRNWHLDLVASFLVVQMSAFNKLTIELTNHPTNKLIQVVEASQGRSLRLSG